eukprot:9283163-Pyramimonas_sp.AAC.1
MEGGTRPRSIEGGGGRSPSTNATRLGRGRWSSRPMRTGSGGSKYNRIRMFITPFGNSAL